MGTEREVIKLTNKGLLNCAILPTEDLSVDSSQRRGFATRVSKDRGKGVVTLQPKRRSSYERLGSKRTEKGDVNLLLVLRRSLGSRRR